MRRHTLGLTLIELMITLAVAAILLSIGVPAMGSFVAENRIAAKSNLADESHPVRPPLGHHPARQCRRLPQ